MRAFFLTGLLLTFGLGRPACADVRVVIDTATRYQTIEGFGTTLSDPECRTPAFENLYMKDLGASLLRIAVDPELQPTEDPDLAHLNLDKLDFNEPGTALSGQLAQALDARKLDRFRVIASLWTPPGWMKDTGSLINGGHLRPDRRQQFGKYLAAFCLGFQKKYGVPIYALSIQNEPMFSEPYVSCQYDPEQMRDAIKAVAAAFQKWGVTTKIQGPEDVGATAAYRVASEMHFINAAEDDPAAAAGLAQFNVHGYGTPGIVAPDSRASWASLRDQTQGYGKPLWQTESSGEGTNWTNKDGTINPTGPLSIATGCHQALVYGNCNAWVYWQMHRGNPAEALTEGTDTTAKKYCVAKHYFRYIRPGAVRVSASGDTDTFMVSAFVKDANKSLTLVMINAASAPQTVHVALPAYPRMTTLRAWRTSAVDSFTAQPPLMAQGGRVTLSLPAQSIVPLYGVGTGQAPAGPGPPTNLIARPGATDVALTWTPAWGASRYSVGRGTQGGPYQTVVSNLTRPRFTDTGLTPGTTYRYKILARSAAGLTSSSAPLTATPAEALVAWTQTPPPLDAAPSAAWDNVKAYPLTHVITGAFGPENEVQGTFQPLWDDQALYLRVNVRDKQVVGTEGSPFNSDSAEVFLDVNNAKRHVYDQDSYQFFFPWVGHYGEVKHGDFIPGMDFARAKTPDGYCLMIKMPFAGLRLPPFAGRTIGLDVQINDADTPNVRQGKRAWWATADNAWQDPSLLGTALLMSAPTLPKPPAAPQEVKATPGDSQAAVSWTPVPGADGYVLRHRVPGSKTDIVDRADLATASGVSLGLDNGKDYAFTVSAFNLGGESPSSKPVTAIPDAAPLPPGSIAINCGGPAVGHFAADEDFAGGSVHVNSTGPVDRRVPSPAPEDVYHSERSGDFTYTIPGLKPSGHYTARLHFTEDYWTQAGQRVFDVTINGAPAIKAFDILREAGGPHKVVVKEFLAQADANGQYVLAFKTITNAAKVDAIEVIPQK